jgi:hypothetical protein
VDYEALPHVVEQVGRLRSVASVGRADRLLDYKHLSNLNEAREAGGVVLGLFEIALAEVDAKNGEKAYDRALKQVAL